MSSATIEPNQARAAQVVALVAMLVGACKDGDTVETERRTTELANIGITVHIDRNRLFGNSTEACRA